MNKRKYIVTYGIVTKQVYPTNDAELEYEWSQMDGGINLMLALKTKLSFYNNSKLSITDFTFFQEIESDINTRCDDVLIEIFKYCNNAWVSEYKGKLQLIAGDWDNDKCTVTMDVIGNNLEDCININKKKTQYPLAQFTFNNPIGSCQTDLGIYGYSGGSYYFLDINSIIAATYPTFNKKANLAGTHYNYGFGTFYNLCRNIVKEMLENCGRDSGLEMLRSDFFDWNPKGDTTGYIASVLPALPESEPRPAGTNREWYLPKTPGINYVTGQTNRLTHLIYIPKSNARNVSSTYWETGVESSGLVGPNRLNFEDIELIWATMFEAYWFIDSDGCMRVEHISWFKQNATTYDSTSLANKKFNEANNKYSYKQDEMYENETFKFGFNASAFNGSCENSNYFPGTFNGYNKIVYSGSCINLGTEKIYTLPKVETDMEIIDSAGSFSFDNYNNEGIFMCSIGSWGTESTICTTGGYTVKAADGNMHFTLLNTILGTNVLYIPDGAYFNAHLQWYYLIRTYLKDNRILKTGLNGTYTLTFTDNTKRIKVQKNIKLLLCCDDSFDANRAKIITELGVGEIESATFNTKFNRISITAHHE